MILEYNKVFINHLYHHRKYHGMRKLKKIYLKNLKLIVLDNLNKKSLDVQSKFKISWVNNRINKLKKLFQIKISNLIKIETKINNKAFHLK